MSTFSRPSNWYELSYDDQRDWDRNERRHREELQDAEDRTRRLEEDAQADQRRAQARSRQLAAERDEIAEEAQTLSVKAARLLDETAQLAERVDQVTTELTTATDLLRGMVGLIQLIRHRRDLPDGFGDQLVTNHRYVDAVAWLKARGDAIE